MGDGLHVLRLANSGCKGRFWSERSGYIERAIQWLRLSISGVSLVDSKVFVGSPEEAGTSYGHPLSDNRKVRMVYACYVYLQ